MLGAKKQQHKTVVESTNISSVDLQSTVNLIKSRSTLTMSAAAVARSGFNQII